MEQLRLVTAVFAGEPGTRRDLYARLADALVDSVHRNSPSTSITVLRTDGDPGTQVAPRQTVPGIPDPGLRGLIENTAKMVAWEAAIEAANDGELVGLLDCDTLVLADLSPIAELAFDVTYTTRPSTSRFPFNSGVVFARISPPVRDFFRRWRELNVRMLADRDMHAPWRAQFGGINQAALGAMIADAPGVQLLPLPCRIWNCEDQSWRLFDAENTRILHVKGRLRRACLHLAATPPDLAHLVELWRGYDRAVA